MKMASSIMVTLLCIGYVIGVVVTLNRAIPPQEKPEAATASMVP